ncbi:MAG: thiamine-phosphate kinase [Rhodospirillaceae bacterium]|nr:thiamine-phosphate kinase [Rhodospirillaceae bacterium]
MLGKGEFGRIRDYLAPLALDGAFDLTDDAATINPEPGCELVITTDTVVEGVHYIGDEQPEQIASKLLRVNLSDLAAMGGVPRAYTLNMTLPRDVKDAWVKAFCQGLADQQSNFGIGLLGGDSVLSPGPATFSATLFGEVPVGQAIRREGASPGDYIFVSGTIGDGALGLLAAKGKLVALDEVNARLLTERYRTPEPRIALGLALRGNATAGTDISDGLLADISHIADVSNVGAIVELAKVPLSSGGEFALKAEPLLWKNIVTGGDDYELVFTGTENLAEKVKSSRVPITCIGRIIAGDGVQLLNEQKKSLHIDVSGYRHG